MICSKCQAISGDDWSQCKGSCPLPMSPHYRAPSSTARASTLPVEIMRGCLWGVDHGAQPSKVLVTGPNRSGIEAKLIWSPGGTHWSGMAGNVYTSSHLGVYRDSGSLRVRMSNVYDGGGRLSRFILSLPKVQQAIVAEWGYEVIPMLDPKVMVCVT